MKIRRRTIRVKYHGDGVRVSTETKGLCVGILIDLGWPCAYLTPTGARKLAAELLRASGDKP